MNGFCDKPSSDAIDRSIVLKLLTRINKPPGNRVAISSICGNVGREGENAEANILINIVEQYSFANYKKNPENLISYHCCV